LLSLFSIFLTFDVEPQYATVSHPSHLAGRRQFIFGGISPTLCPLY
jgi:hypothetical protein